MSKNPKSLGAMLGAGLFIVLWLGMLGTLGELLLLIPAAYFVALLGVEVPPESILWRSVAAIISAAACGFIGAWLGPSVFATYDRAQRSTRIAVIVILGIVFVMVLLVGRNLRIH